MGDIKKSRKQYSVPRKRWDKGRIEAEKKVLETFGLKNKKELRKFETVLRKKRENARGLLALSGDKRQVAEKELFESISRLGLLPRNSSVDDVLSLQINEILERRLQTFVWRKNLARTIKQARQFIVHGHISLNGKKITAPGYIVKSGEEEKLGYYNGPLELMPPTAKTKETIQKKFEDSLPAEDTDAAEETPAVTETELEQE